MDHDEFAFEYMDEKASFEESVLNRISVEELRDAFLKLPDQQQHVLEYKYLLGMTDREIGKILGVRPGTVRSYLARARKAVYQICKGDGYAKA
jgi:RNA polymerase sigma-70 factor (ECF subfamily)